MGDTYPLHEACRKGRIEEVERLLAYGICLVNETDKFGQTALHIASFQGHIDIVKLLIKKMAFLSIQDKNGWTPLHAASSAGNLQICEILIREGADPNVQSISKSTPLHYLTSLACSDLLLFVMHLIIKRSDLINLKNEFGITPLQNACLRNGEAVILYLLCNGADPNITNNQNEAPIHTACSAGKLRVVQLLIDFGADIDMIGPDGTPEQTAERYNHMEIVEFLKGLRLKSKQRQKERKQSKSKLAHEKKLDRKNSENEDKIDLDNKDQLSNEEEPFEDVTINEKSNKAIKDHFPTESRERSMTHDPTTKVNLEKKKWRNSIEYIKRHSKLEIKDIFCIKDPSENNIVIQDRKYRVPIQKKEEPFSRLLDEISLISEIENKKDSNFGHCEILREDAIIENCDGWCANTKSIDPSTSKLFIEDDEITTFHYKDNFFDNENIINHYNFIGFLNNNSNQSPEPIIISVLPKDEIYWGLIRTSMGDITFHINVKPRKGYNSKKILKILEDHNADIKNAKLIPCKDNNIAYDLLEFEKTEKNQFNKINTHKVGILYVKEGQKTEEEILENKTGSANFKEFLNFIGQTVNLQGFEGYNGGLDTKKNRSGKKSVFTKWFDFEIMFHVSTHLPLLSDDEKYVEKKKHIGNDMTCIVFLDGKNRFNPKTITSNFLHVYIVIQALGNSKYKMAITRKNGVPDFGPPLPSPPIFSKHEVFRDFLLSKIINAERATLNGLLFKQKRRYARKTLLEIIIKKYM